MSKQYEGFSTHVTGITGFGKSYFVKKTLIPLLVKYKPVIIFDYEGEYAGARSKDSNKKWNSYEGITDFFDFLAEKKQLTKQVHVISARNNSDYIRGIKFLDVLRAQISIILDESQFVFQDPKLKTAKVPLVRMVRSGRKDGTDIILISQRTMDMPPDIRSQFSRRISFFQHHDDDLRVLYKENGFEDAEKVKDLDKRKYMVFGKFPEYLSGQL